MPHRKSSRRKFILLDTVQGSRQKNRNLLSKKLKSGLPKIHYNLMRSAPISSKSAPNSSSYNEFSVNRISVFLKANFSFFAESPVRPHMAWWLCVEIRADQGYGAEILVHVWGRCEEMGER